MAVATQGRCRLNHVEFAHRPGESGLAVELFEALGCSCDVIDAPPYGKYVVVSLDGSPHGENDLFVSEAEPEQLAFEAALEEAIDSKPSELSRAEEGFRALGAERPFRVNHVGIRLPSVAALEAAVERLSALAEGALAARLQLGYTMERGEEEARATDTPLKQIWIWTDVISAGLLAIGQQIELQAYDA